MQASGGQASTDYTAWAQPAHTSGSGCRAGAGRRPLGRAAAPRQSRAAAGGVGWPEGMDAEAGPGEPSQGPEGRQRRRRACWKQCRWMAACRGLHDHPPHPPPSPPLPPHLHGASGHQASRPERRLHRRARRHILLLAQQEGSFVRVQHDRGAGEGLQEGGQGPHVVRVRVGHCGGEQRGEMCGWVREGSGGGTWATRGGTAAGGQCRRVGAHAGWPSGARPWLPCAPPAPACDGWGGEQDG